MKPLVIIGCGGFGREVHDIVDAINTVEPTWNLLGYLDDAPTVADTALVAQRGYSVMGVTSWLLKADRTHFVIGIGSANVRRSIDEQYRHSHHAAILRHPASTVGHDVTIGPGSVLCAGARLTTHIRIGRHVHVDQNVTIGHDTVIGDYARLNPQACVSGNVRVGKRTLIGASATILQGLAVGRDSVVGAGSCVTRDIPAERTVKGVPAR